MKKRKKEITILYIRTGHEIFFFVFNLLIFTLSFGEESATSEDGTTESLTTGAGSEEELLLLGGGVLMSGGSWPILRLIAVLL